MRPNDHSNLTNLPNSLFPTDQFDVRLGWFADEIEVRISLIKSDLPNEKDRHIKITLDEIKTELSRRGLEEDIIHEIEKLFSSHELYSYRKRSGGSGEFEPSILSRIARVASELERRFS